MDIEPIDVVLDSEEIATSDQVTGTRDNPSFTINPPITECVGLAVLYASVPFTYYVIDRTCNSFELTYQSTTYTCSMTPGTFNSTNVGGELIAAISRAADSTVAGSFTAYVDTTDNNFVIYNNTAGSGISFTLNFNVLNSVYRTLGFNQSSYSSAATTFYDNSETAITKHRVIAPRVINLTGPGQMYLNSDLGGSLFGKVRNQTAAQGLLGFWPVNSNYTGTIETFRENPIMIPVGKSTITKINLKLLLGNRTEYDVSNTGILDHLPLNGESFQVAIRFFRAAAGERTVTDAAGNSTTTSQDSTKSFAPRRYLTTQDAYDSQRIVQRRRI